MFGNIWRKPIDASTTSSSGPPAISDEQRTRKGRSELVEQQNNHARHTALHANHVVNMHESLRDLQKKQTEVFEKIGEVMSDVRNMRRGLNDYSDHLDEKVALLVHELSELRQDLRVSSEAHSAFLASAEKRLDDLERSRTYLMGVLRSLRLIGGVISAAAVTIVGLVIRMFMDSAN